MMTSVQLINIHKAFSDASQVIKGVDLHIADGEQVETPLELYEKPANMFVASFLGSLKMNFIKAKVVGNNEQENQVQLESGELFSLSINLRSV